MSLTVVGSIAFDAVQTPHGGRERMLGGAAVHFALAASFFDEVRVVGPVGDDFGDEEYAVLHGRDVITDDIEHVAGGKTFFWKGVYHENMNSRDTLETDLNVFEHFDPKLSQASKDVRRPVPREHPARAAAQRPPPVRAARSSSRWTRWTCGSTSPARRSSPRSPRSTA